jgi:hypothetical protein
VAICKPGREEALTRNKISQHLILDFEPPDYEKEISTV